MNHKAIMLLALASVPALHGMEQERKFTLGERVHMFLCTHKLAAVGASTVLGAGVGYFCDQFARSRGIQPGHTPVINSLIGGYCGCLIGGLGAVATDTPHVHWLIEERKRVEGLKAEERKRLEELKAERSEQQYDDEFEKEHEHEFIHGFCDWQRYCTSRPVGAVLYSRAEDFTNYQQMTTRQRLAAAHELGSLDKYQAGNGGSSDHNHRHLRKVIDFLERKRERELAQARKF